MFVWMPKKCKKIDCHKDDRDQASMYHNHVIAIYKQEKKILIGWSMHL